MIVPVYDREHLIAEALTSVLAQSLSTLDVIVVDDGSTDATPDVVRGFGDAVRYVRQDHAGISAARNRGLAAACGRVVAFLDSDDVWVDGMLASAVRHLEAGSEQAAVHGRAEIIRLPDAGDHRPRFREDAEPLYRPLLGSMVFRRECFERVGDFDEAMQRSEDLDWLNRAAELGIVPARIDELWLRYRVHASNITNDIPATTSSMVASVKLALDRRRGAQKP